MILQVLKQQYGMLAMSPHLATLQENVFVIRENMILYANNKGADQTAHPGSLISTFVISSLESITTNFYTCKVSVF